MNVITLNYPNGEFTQAELAAFNGLDKVIVYLPMKEAIAKGILNFSGTRPHSSGRGKPSNLYQVASNNAPVAITALPLPQPIVETPSAQATPPVVKPEPNLPDAVILAKELDKAIQEHRPPEPIPQPVVTMELPNPSPAVVKLAPRIFAPNPAYPCPLCQKPMTEVFEESGMTVKCYNVPCDPQCNENPYGHGKNSKEAYEVAKQRFRL